MRAGAPRFTLSAGSLWLLGFALFCFYMLTGSRERPWADATPMYEVAEALVNRGEFNIATAWPVDLERGRRGKTYAIAPLLQSLQHVPGVLIRKGLSWVWRGTHDLAWPFAAHIGPSALGAWTVVMFISICRCLGLALRPTLAAAAALAFGTMVWIYARSPYSEMLQTACFTAFALQVLRNTHETTRKSALLLGLTAGLLINAKVVFALALMGGGVWLSIHTWGQWPRLRRLVGWSAAAFLPLALLLPLYNWARWGSPLASGYNLNIPVFEERLGLGLWGLLFSPGKSVWLYCPPLLLSVVALPRMWRQHRWLLAFIALLVGPVIALYGKMLYWSGDYAWGPRYLTFAVPLSLLPGAWLVHDVMAAAPGWARRLKLAGVGLLLVVGLGVQVLGASFYWDHFIRISQQARFAWLGEPDREGAPTPTVEGVCGACFEDVHQVQWLPAFTPLEGHLWLLRHQLAGHDWQQAARDAPWARYTRLPIDIEESYGRVRIDWWPLAFFERGRHGMAVVLCLWFVFGIVASLWKLATSRSTKAFP